ncbi:Metallo-dependent phosphatase-like protein [Russula compacta]|nr:Metallo-dependent phosphatase-like protein [Russula compacta]
MKVAVEGCCHGELDAIYRRIQRLESEKKYKVDLLLICGDFEAIRDNHDLRTMAVPEKYRYMGDFHKYYTGQATAPLLTVVIGGNHEASNHLWELYHGGWLAPNIYFLGHAGCVQVNGIRIAGASGIFKEKDYHHGHFEREPYNDRTMRSIYHIREYNVRRLSLLSSPDVFLSHDWPRGIEHHGDLDGLLRRKPLFRDDIMSHQLGSPPLMSLLRNLQPTWWFAAHLHTRFEARVRHHDPPEPVPPSSGSAPRAGNPDEIAIGDDDDDDEREDAGQGQFDTRGRAATASGASAAAPQNPDEIVLDDEIETVQPPPAPPRETKFLALDKCLPNRQFLEVLDIPTPEEARAKKADPPHDGDGSGSGSGGGGTAPPHTSAPGTTPLLSYDPEWLAITRAFQPYLSREYKQAHYPDPDAARAAVAREWDWVHAHVLPKLDDGSSSCWRVEACQRFIPGNTRPAAAALPLPLPMSTSTSIVMARGSRPRRSQLCLRWRTSCDKKCVFRVWGEGESLQEASISIFSLQASITSQAGGALWQGDVGMAWKGVVSCVYFPLCIFFFSEG